MRYTGEPNRITSFIAVVRKNCVDTKREFTYGRGKNFVDIHAPQDALQVAERHLKGYVERECRRF